MRTHILNTGIAAVLLCIATLSAYAQTPVYSANTQPQITAKLAVGDANHFPTPDGLYILLSNSEGVAVAQRNQTDDDGRPVIKTFLPHPGMSSFTFFYDGNTRYVATYGKNQLRIYQWIVSSEPQSHTGTIYNTTAQTSGAQITSMGAIKVGDGEGGSFWLIVLGSAKPSKIYTYRLNGTFVKDYYDHGGAGVMAIASDPYPNPPARYARIATTGDGGTVTIWTSNGDASNPLRASRKLFGGRTTLNPVSFVPLYANGLTAIGKDRRLYYWDLQDTFSTPRHVYNFADEYSEGFAVSSISFSPNGYAIIPMLYDAYWFEMPTTSNPNRFRFVGKRRLLSWDEYSLSWITAYAVRTPPVNILSSSNQMLVSFNNAYMTYKDAPWNVYHRPGAVPLASCVTNTGLAAVTTSDRRIYIYQQQYIGGSPTAVAFTSLPDPAHSITYLGATRGSAYFLVGAGDGKMQIVDYNSLANSFIITPVSGTPPNMRGALLVDAHTTGSLAIVACASPTDGNVLIYVWGAANPTTLNEYNPSGDSDLLPVGHVIRDLRVIQSPDGLHVGGAIRRQTYFTALFNEGFPPRPNLGSSGDGLSFDWNPANLGKFALLLFRNTVFVDSPPLIPRSEIGSGLYNQDLPWAIRYNDGSSVAISYRTRVECFRATNTPNGLQFLRSERIVPERTGTFTTLTTRYTVGSQSYWVLGDTNGTVSFALPEAVQQAETPTSISFSYNEAYARPSFFTLSCENPSSPNNRFAAIAYTSFVTPRPSRTYLLRLNQSNPAGYKVEKVLPGVWFLCPFIHFQSVHRPNYARVQTERYRFNDVLTSTSPTPIQTIDGIHERFSFNGQYCVTQTLTGYNFYRFAGASWQLHGSIMVDLQYATKCYISDTGNYAVVFQDRDNRLYCDIYQRTGSLWSLKHSLRDRVYHVFNSFHGAGELGDFIPFVFLPNSDWFCVNYDLDPDDSPPGNPSAEFDPHLILLNAAAANPLATLVDLGMPSYTFSFLVSGGNTFLLRLNSDPNNAARLAVYNVTNPSSPSLVAEFHRETSRSSGFFTPAHPIVGNYGFGLFTNSFYGVVFNYPSVP